MAPSYNIGCSRAVAPGSDEVKCMGTLTEKVRADMTEAMKAFKVVTHIAGAAIEDVYG